MVDGVQLSTNIGVGEVMATDDDGAFQHQYVKVEFGADNVQTPVDENNPLPVSVSNNDLLSTNNSTTVTLAGAASYTGIGDDCEGYSTVTITLFASHASAIDGMTFQFSTDNSNWDDTYTFNMDAGATRRFQFPVTAKYFRINYTNGATTQTAFRVQTILHRQNVLTSVHRLGNDLSPDRSASVNISAIVAQKTGAGDFIPVQSTTGGNLKVAIEENDAGLATEVTQALIETNTDYGTVIGGGTQAGSLRVNIATDNTVIVDGSAVTQPVSAASLPLPTGAATNAAQLPDGHNVTIDNASGASAVNIQDGGNSITIDGAVTANAGTGTFTVDGSGVTQPVSAVSLPLPTGSSTSANQLPDGHNVTVDNASGASAVNIQDGGNSITIDGTVTANAGTGTFNVDLGANNDVTVTGNVAHDTADSGNPVKTGGKAIAFDGTAPGTDVAENDRVDSIHTVDGRQFVETSHPNYWSSSNDYASAQTNATLKTAPGAGLKLYITDIIMSNGATAGNITLLDGSGGTVLIEDYPAINGGLTISLRTPLVLTANTLLAITSTTVTTHTVTVSGFIAA